MNHNYKLTDFKKQREYVDEPDLKAIEVTMCLHDTLEMPSILEKRLEHIVNNLIADHEEKNDIILPLDDIEVESCITVNTMTKELLIEVYIGYDINVELLHRKEVIDTSDEHYLIIKKFYFYKLNEYVTEQVRRIAECIQ